MKSAPLIPVTEFENFISSHCTADGVTTIERRHPDFGKWKERSMDLGDIKIFEHQTEITNDINVHFENENSDAVHHCMSLQGNMDANFFGFNMEARLTPLSYHTLFIPYHEYSFGMGPTITNIHLEISRKYYSSFLSDSEKWSAEMKTQLLKDKLYYSGERKLSQVMVQTIYSIFNSPLSGSLKKLLVEAKIHELVALQLYHATDPIIRRKQSGETDMMHAIKDFLDGKYLEPHTLRGIAKHFGVNEFTLKKGFRNQFNTTVFDYILMKRLEHGRELLRSSDKTILEVSMIVGYKYPNHFSTAFKKMFGVNPTEVRA